MIPLPALSAIPWKLIGWAVAVLAVAALGWRVSVWRGAYKALPAAQEALQREIECGKGSECLKRAQAAQAKAEAAAAVTVKGYQDEIESLRNRPLSVRTVRVCPPVADRNVRDASAARSADGTGPGAGLGDGGTRPDIGPGLYSLAARCDEVTARLRGLQGWNAALATVPEKP